MIARHFWSQPHAPFGGTAGGQIYASELWLAL